MKIKAGYWVISWICVGGRFNWLQIGAKFAPGLYSPGISYSRYSVISPCALRCTASAQSCFSTDKLNRPFLLRTSLHFNRSSIHVVFLFFFLFFCPLYSPWHGALYEPRILSFSLPFSPNRRRGQISRNQFSAGLSSPIRYFIAAEAECTTKVDSRCIPANPSTPVHTYDVITHHLYAEHRHDDNRSSISRDEDKDETNRLSLAVKISSGRYLIDHKYKRATIACESLFRSFSYKHVNGSFQ